MWRRVLSQSPETVPTDAAGASRLRQYLDGWKALGALLHSGRSLSGRERNCCFLNTGGPRFADVSSAVGFDHPSDSRGLALTDWDMDGDLDLWVTNRTSPRVRYLQNNIRSGNHFLAFKLRGVNCNRDAIGARVELHFSSNGKAKLVQTVSAGEGFVSQSSKWIHFGLGAVTHVDRIVIHWPGGANEEIRGLQVDQHYEITEGQGEAVVWTRPTPGHLSPSVPIAPARSDTARIVLPQRLPFPRIDFQGLHGESVQLDQFAGGPLLLNLWASWCQPCLNELTEWKEHVQRIERAGLTVVALNVEYVEADPLANIAEARAKWEQLDLPFHGGVVDARTFELLEVVERVLLLQQGPLPIPISFLIDAEGQLAAVYKGPLSVERLMTDVGGLDQVNADVRDAAVPFAGKWYTDPFPPDLLAIPAQMVGLGRGVEAYDYLTRHLSGGDRTISKDAWQQLGVTPQKVAGVCHATARLLLTKGSADNAVNAYRLALKYDPESWNTHVELSSLLIRLGKSTEAIAQSRMMLHLRPDHPLPWNNIAWVLATSKDPESRDAAKAISVAERVCQSTGFREPTALDTLAVAYAAAGRFREAVEAAKKAERLATSLGQDAVAEQIRARLRLFEAGQPYEP